MINCCVYCHINKTFADKYNLKTKNIGNSCRLGTTTQGYSFKYVEVA